MNGASGYAVTAPTGPYGFDLAMNLNNPQPTYDGQAASGPPAGLQLQQHPGSMPNVNRSSTWINGPPPTNHGISQGTSFLQQLFDLNAPPVPMSSNPDWQSVPDPGALLGPTSPQLTPDDGSEVLTLREVTMLLRQNQRENARLRAENERMNAEIAQMHTEVAETRHLLNATEEGGLVSNRVLLAIHKTARGLLGADGKVTPVDDVDAKPYWRLPDPLSNGGMTRKAADGTTDLYNPLWDQSVDAPHNATFINAVVALVMVDEATILAHEHVSQERLVKCTKTYFRALKSRYRLQQTAEGRKRIQVGHQKGTRAQRRRKQADDDRKAARLLQRFIGRANTVGMNELIQSDWESPVVSSDEEDSGREERARLRELAGVSRGNWELRSLTWKSRALVRFYAALKGITAATPALQGFLHSISPPDVKPEDDTRDFATDQQARFLEIVKQNANCTVAEVFKRFRGRPAPDGLPGQGPLDHQKRSRGTVWKECISETWAQLSEEHATYYTTSPGHPATHTIFEAVNRLPDELFRTVDMTSGRI